MRHVGDALFMATIDNPDVVTFIVQGVKKPVELHTRQAKNGVKAMGSDEFDQGLAAGHTGRLRHRGLNPIQKLPWRQPSAPINELNCGL